MKKRIIALVCALALVMGMSTTAMAKPSQEGGRIEAADALGNVINIIKTTEEALKQMIECDHGDGCQGAIEVLTPVLSMYREIFDSFNIDSLLEGTKYEGKEFVKLFEMELIAKDCIDGAVTFRLDKKDWPEGKPVVAHYKSAEKTWELIETTDDGDAYVFTVNSYSPFAFYVEKNGSGTTSPSTGDPLSLGVVMMAAGAAGLAVVSKKRRA